MADLDDDGTTPVKRLADYGLAKVVMIGPGDSGDMVVTVRILPAEDARRIMNDLVNSSATLG